MADPILEYIEKERKQGFSNKDILKRMTQAGYNEQKVRALLTQPTIPKRQTNKYHTLEVIFAILILLALLVSVFFMVTDSSSTSQDTEEVPEPWYYIDDNGVKRLIISETEEKDLNG